jgi:tetratricopeptide (TPR) repeat protein
MSRHAIASCLATLLVGCAAAPPPNDGPVSVEVEPAALATVAEEDELEEPAVATVITLHKPAWTAHDLEDEPTILANATLADKEQAKDAYKAGLHAFDTHDFGAALAHFVRAHEAHPGAAPKWRIAGCLHKLGRYDEAVVAYRWFLASEPSDKYADRIQQANERIKLLAPGFEANVAIAKKYHRAGVTAFTAGDYEAAKHEFLKAYAAAPRPQMLYNIATCDLRLGNAAAACATYVQFLREAGPSAGRSASLDGICGSP